MSLSLFRPPYGLDHGAVVEALMERESLGPTGVGHGVALPHARLPGLDKVVGTFILLGKADRLFFGRPPAC